MPRRPKTNEIKYPYVVELAIVGDGLDVELNRQIISFNNAPPNSSMKARALVRSEKQTIMGFRPSSTYVATYSAAIWTKT